LPNGASLKATEAQAKKVEALLAEPDMSRSVKIFASYLGNGSPRFYLPLDQQLFNDNFAQFVIMTHDIAAREDLKRRLEERFADGNGRLERLANARAAPRKWSAGRFSGHLPRFR
jgi:multidrug efflux pump